ncbi:uncharacterized protein MEPE_01243 [Melanopsichium pennsylvanicum]|uniref:Uncharacterized protein n=1 Tax=Melanopsichium pennsylvanicum TaxID=63383 RepID=A0AAJ4XHR1_9BASI|nr:uncharacterized protein MEPE_01243 [Melanopsichium pennsylvanicum]
MAIGNGQRKVLVRPTPLMTLDVYEKQDNKIKTNDKKGAKTVGKGKPRRADPEAQPDVVFAASTREKQGFKFSSFCCADLSTSKGDREGEV